MVSVDPRILIPENNQNIKKPQRNNILSVVALISTQNVFKVKVENDKIFHNTLLRMSQELTRIANKKGNDVYLEELRRSIDGLVHNIEKNLNNTSLNKSDIKADVISQFSVGSLENLNVDGLKGMDVLLKSAQEISSHLASTDKVTKESLARVMSLINDAKSSLIVNKSLLPTLISEIKKIIPSKMEYPDIQKVNGDMRITSLPKIEEISKMVISFDQLAQELRSRSVPDNKTAITDNKKLLEALSNIKNSLDQLPKEFPEVIVPNEVRVSNFPPTKTPLPVTNININPLRGFAKSTSVTVTTALTVLPPETLAYRRSLIVFNNSSSTTVYIGGSTMVATDGLPVLAQTYSPTIDAGPKMIIYGKTTAGSADVRVLEVSNERGAYDT